MKYQMPLARTEINIQVGKFIFVTLRHMKQKIFFIHNQATQKEFPEIMNSKKKKSYACLNCTMFPQKSAKHTSIQLFSGVN